VTASAPAGSAQPRLEPVGNSDRLETFSEHQLHDSDVEPAVELAADLSLNANELEATGGVQSPRGGAFSLNSSDHAVESAGASDAADFGEQESADTASGVASVDVDRILDRRRVGGPFLVAREGGEAEHAVINGIGCDDRGECSGTTGQPLSLLLDRPRDDVERRYRVQHLVVVDLSDLSGVVGGRLADLDGSGSGCGGHVRRA